MTFLRTSACLAAAFMLVSSSSAAELGRAVTPTLSEETGVTGFSIQSPADLTATANQYWIDFVGGGDTFGYAARLGGSEPVGTIEADPAFAILDDSLSIPNDNFGSILSGDSQNFFGASDTVNADSSTGQFAATWTFDVSSAVGGLTLGVDIAAMGDFEPADVFTFAYSFDGANFTDVLVSSNFDTSFTSEQLDDPATLQLTNPENVYTLESAKLVALNDPHQMNGEFLNNVFKNFSVAIGEAASSTLSIRFSAVTDGGDEGFVFRNLTIDDGGEGPGGTVGDYNDDGFVDAADYTVWQDNLTFDGSALANRDPGQTGPVNQTDYSVWVGAFGQPALGAIGGAAVPEPGTLLMAFGAGLALIGCGRRACR